MPRASRTAAPVRRKATQRQAAAPRPAAATRRAPVRPAARTSPRGAGSGGASAPRATGEGFRAAVFGMIARIPPGRVATYGQIARLAGYPRRARHVGMALAHPPPGVQIPWHRVITAQGRIARRGGASRGGTGDGTQPGPAESRQMTLLQAEGVTFRKGRVDLLRFGWRPEGSALAEPPRRVRRRRTQPAP